MENSTRLSRLKHWVTVLKAVPTKKFVMDSWTLHNYFDKPLRLTLPSNFIRVECRTAACALGWAAFDKKFRRQGLSLDLHHSGDHYNSIRFKSAVNEYAAEEFFGIKYEEAVRIIAPSKYPENRLKQGIKSRHVIKQIQKLIKKYSKK